MRFFRWGLLLALLTVAMAVWADEASELRAFTGTRTRAVWLQDIPLPADAPADAKPNCRVMGLDTDDGKGVHAIVPEFIPHVSKAVVISADGQQVIFQGTDDNYAINWDGTGLRKLNHPGNLYETWADPDTGVQWVLIRTLLTQVSRIRLDKPEIAEVLWDKTSTNWFQLTADGSRAAGAFPWNKCGVATLPNISWEQYEAGCYPSMAPDNSYRFWVLRGNHRTAAMFDDGGLNRRIINFAEAPGAEGGLYETFFPRWTNDVRFLTLTTPYKSKATPEERNAQEIVIGRFNADYTGVEAWLQISRNTDTDYVSDIWIEGAPGNTAKAAVTTAAKPLDKWPLTHQGLQFLWVNAKSSNQLLDADGKTARVCNIEAHGEARFGRDFEMLPGTGWIEADQQTNDALLTACKASNQLTIEALITPSTTMGKKGLTSIIAFCREDQQTNFRLLQEQGMRLTLEVRTATANARQPLCTLPAGQTSHVLITFTSGMTVCYLNGERVLNGAARLEGMLSAWQPAQLTFGAEMNGVNAWGGHLEKVAIYSRFMGWAADDAAAKARYALATKELAARTPATRLVVNGKLVSRTAAPTPASIAPYRRCLAINRYVVEQVVEGTYEEKEINVAQWVLLDGKVLDDYAKWQLEKSYPLTLEPLDEHPEMESERQVMDGDDLGLPIYVLTP